MHDNYDFIIVGGGISGSFWADEVTRAGKRCLVIEAGEHLTDKTYPRKEIDANGRLYWSGGMELNSDASLLFLRPKVVGGGSVVNQALVDRFDDLAFEDWQRVSGMTDLNASEFSRFYEAAESRIQIQTIPETHRNENARLFEKGFKANGYQCAPLQRAQSNCRYEEGNDCIECLAGCRINSKQSMGITTLKSAVETGLLTVWDQSEVLRIKETADAVQVWVRSVSGMERLVQGNRLVLASGAIGNTKILFQSDFGQGLPALGERFFSHPQFMYFGVYDQKVNSHRGPFQAFKSADPGFRKAGFKLENVFAPPGSLSVLFPGFAEEHRRTVSRYSHLSCIEVAVRDTHPGKITVNRAGKVTIQKTLNDEDRTRLRAGREAVGKIFSSTGAKEIVDGRVGIGLHLMGGCGMGVDRSKSVVGPDYHLHGHRRVFASDSSVFPSAPGINPSLTIMAQSIRAARLALAEVGL